MTEVSFYVLASPDAEARSLFACRLAEKAWALGNRIHIHVSDRDAVTHMDELLWSFRPTSFIPHQPWREDAKAPVTIGCDARAEVAPGDLLINLGSEVPARFSAFLKVAEVVTDVPTIQQITRNHYRFYRDHGYPLQTHHLRG